MTKKELDKMKERERATSKGPWFRGFKDKSGNGEDEWREGGAYIVNKNEEVIVHGGDYEGIPIGVLKIDDAEFIINARKDVPKLIKVVDKLQEEVGRAWKEVDRLQKIRKSLEEA